ncbi:MAG: hypothetical protein ACTSXU_15290, partial [Promethearchaeota archaeon]
MTLKSASQTIIDKLRVTYIDGRYQDVMEELMHYILDFGLNSEHLLLSRLVALLKEVVIKDIEHIFDNLARLDRLFFTRVDVLQDAVIEILNVFSTVKDFRGQLFHKYFSRIGVYLSVLDVELKSRFIQILVKYSTSSMKNLEALTSYLLKQVELCPKEELCSIIGALAAMLFREPKLGVMFRTYLQHIFNRYIFDADVDSIHSFLGLFSFLVGYRSYFLKLVNKWINSGELTYKKKVLDVLSLMIGKSFSKESMLSLLNDLGNDNMEYQSSVVDVLASIVDNNVNYYIPWIIEKYYKRALNDVELQGYLELLTKISEKHLSAVFNHVVLILEQDDPALMRKSITLLKNLALEYSTQFEILFFRAFENLSSYHWLAKKEWLKKIWTIVSSIKSDVIVMWFARCLQKILKESDWEETEVIDTSREIFEKLQKNNKDIVDKIINFNEKIDFIEKNLQVIKNFPRMVREHVEFFIEKGNYSRAIKVLDSEYRSSMEKIVYFDNYVNSIDFRHLVLNLVDEWFYSKDFIIEDLNIVKNYLEETLKEKLLNEYYVNESRFTNLEKKREILLLELEELEKKIGRLDSVKP